MDVDRYSCVVHPFMRTTVRFLGSAEASNDKRVRAIFRLGDGRRDAAGQDVEGAPVPKQMRYAQAKKGEQKGRLSPLMFGIQHSSWMQPTRRRRRDIYLGCTYDSQCPWFQDKNYRTCSVCKRRGPKEGAPRASRYRIVGDNVRNFRRQRSFVSTY